MNDRDGKTHMRNSLLASEFMLVHVQIVKNKIVYFGLFKPISLLTEKNPNVSAVCQCCLHCIEGYEHIF